MAGYNYPDGGYYADEGYYSNEAMPVVPSGGSPVVHHCGLALFVDNSIPVPQPPTVARPQFNSNNSYQQTTRWNHHDKNTGSYTKATVKEEASTGHVFKERGSGRVGFKDEVKQTSTFRVGNKSGYTEYQVEERVRNVNFGGGGGRSSSSSQQIGGRSSNYNNRLSYNKKY